MVGRVTSLVYVRRLAFASADSGSVAVFSLVRLSPSNPNTNTHD